MQPQFNRGHSLDSQRAPQQPRGELVRTNFYKITGYPKQDYALYDISFEPDIPASQLKKRTELVHHLQVNVAPATFQPRILYDGRSIAYAHPTTRENLGVEQAFRVRLRDDSLLPFDAQNVTTIRFKATRADDITGGEVRDVFVDGSDSGRRPSLLNFMQLLVSDSKHPSNRRAYFPTQGNTVFPSLEIRRGVFQSVRPVVQSLAIVVDTTVSAFYQSGQLVDALMAFFKLPNSTHHLRDVRELVAFKDRSQWERADKFFKGVIIREKKGQRKGGRRKIKGFHPQGALYEFEGVDGEPVSIKTHYKDTHNIHLRYPTLPGVILRRDPPEIVPMELCEIEPGQFFRKSLPQTATQEMLKMATMRPEDKSRYIKGTVSSYGKWEAVQDAGMSVSTQPMEVTARLLPPPQLAFKKGKQTIFENVKDGKWNFVQKELLQHPESCHWAVLDLAPGQLRSDDLQKYMKMFQRCANNLGLPLGDPLHTRSFQPIVRKLKENLDGFMKAVRENAGSPRGSFFILCVLDQEASAARAALKYWGDVLEGIVTQCVRVDQVKKNGNNSQYWNNVVLKVNARVSGVNFYPANSPIMQRISQLKNPTMIVGLDIGHASPGLREPSVVGLVYSIDQRGVKYSAFTALQEPRQESIVELRPMFKAALKDFVIHSGTLPRNVVVFRDGVSEGEYERVRKVEVKAIHDAMMDLLEEGAPVNTQPRPNLTFIVVGKRHHALIFPKTDGVKDNRGNCKAGTVVSEGITQPDVENFYLMSHAAIIGTSRSSHYIVLLDEVFGSTKLIEELSYALCHIYARATRSVSIPAPVYYADLVCRRKSFHFQPGVEEDLRFNDNASVASGSSYPPLDLKAWQEKFSKKAKLTAMNFL